MIGHSLSSLRKKLPLGPSILKIDLGVNELKMKLVSFPLSTRRIWSSIRFELVGALAMSNILSQNLNALSRGTALLNTAKIEHQASLILTGLRHDSND